MHEDLLAHIRRIVREEISHLQGGMQSPYLYGTWLSAESVDVNLSQVQLVGEVSIIARGVRKLEHVSGLTAGKQVLMLKHGTVPLTIIGVIKGNITALELP